VATLGRKTVQKTGTDTIFGHSPAEKLVELEKTGTDTFFGSQFPVPGSRVRAEEPVRRPGPDPFFWAFAHGTKNGSVPG